MSEQGTVRLAGGKAAGTVRGTVGRIHSIETLGLLDGPGIRTVIFLQGCPLRCAYCHNPDSQPLQSAAATEMTPAEVLALAERQRSYFGEEGGVTFSGGEPLLQGAFLVECLQLLRDAGISTAVDTSGFGDPHCYGEVLPLVDTLLLDVKAFDPERFRDLIQGSYATWVNFADSLVENGFEGQIWVRHVMLPGWTDDEASMERLVETVLPLGYLVDRIDILPYHTMGIEKHAEMGRPYRLEGMPPMDETRAWELERYANRRFIERLAAGREAGAGSRISVPRRKESEMNQIRENPYAVEPDADQAWQRDGVDLRRLPLVRHLSIAAFDELMSDLQVLHVRKGDVFFRSGDPADRLYIVATGQFKIYRYTVDGREQILYIYNPGDFVGGHNLLTGHRYVYNGQALEDSLICTMSKDFFDRHCLDNPRILRQILEKSYDRIRWAEDLISRLSSANAGIKTAELILRFADRYGVQTSDGIRIELNLNREELGSYAGLSRETFTRKLGEFRELGYLDFSGNRVILVKDPDALLAYFEG